MSKKAKVSNGAALINELDDVTERVIDEDHKNLDIYLNSINSLGRKRKSSNLIIQKHASADALDKRNLSLLEQQDCENLLPADQQFLAPEYEELDEKFLTKRKCIYSEDEFEDSLF